MDKKIVDKLIQFGLITNVGVDANKYTDVDDLIAKGIVTVPGAKTKIMELIGDDGIVIEELPTEDAVVVETPTEEASAVDTPTEEEVTEPEVVVEEVTEEVTKEEIVEEATEPEVVVEEATVSEETPAKSEKKASKSTKN
jgi:hypothetical protein